MPRLLKHPLQVEDLAPKYNGYVGIDVDELGCRSGSKQSVKRGVREEGKMKRSKKKPLKRLLKN